MAARPLQILVYRGDGNAAAFAALIRAPRGRVALHVASTLDEAARIAPEIDVVFGWKTPPALYEKTSRLTWLQTMGAGVDWALVPELPPRVVVTRVPGVFGPWMAEYVLGWCTHVTQRVDTYRAALARAPDMADAHYNLALLCEAQGRRQEALRHLNAYRKLNP